MPTPFRKLKESAAPSPTGRGQTPWADNKTACPPCDFFENKFSVVAVALHVSLYTAPATVKNFDIADDAERIYREMER